MSRWAIALRSTLSAGKIYVIEMSKTPGSQLDSYLRVETLAGKTLAEDDDSGGNPNACIIFTAPSSAEFRIVATSSRPGMTGDFTLAFSELIKD